MVMGAIGDEQQHDHAMGQGGEREEREISFSKKFMPNPGSNSRDIEGFPY